MGGSWEIGLCVLEHFCDFVSCWERRPVLLVSCFELFDCALGTSIRIIYDSVLPIFSTELYSTNMNQLSIVKSIN